MALFIGRLKKLRNSIVVKRCVFLISHSFFFYRLALDTHPRDLEHIFDKYGRLNRLEVKRGYAFVEYQDQRDASDALKGTDGMVCKRETVFTLIVSYSHP